MKAFYEESLSYREAGKRFHIPVSTIFGWAAAGVGLGDPPKGIPPTGRPTVLAPENERELEAFVLAAASAGAGLTYHDLCYQAEMFFGNECHLKYSHKWAKGFCKRHKLSRRLEGPGRTCGPRAREVEHFFDKFNAYIKDMHFDRIFNMDEKAVTLRNEKYWSIQRVGAKGRLIVSSELRLLASLLHISLHDVHACTLLVSTQMSMEDDHHRVVRSLLWV